LPFQPSRPPTFILIPVQPSPYDIWATADLVELVKQRIEVTDGKLQAAFVVSRAIKGTRIGAELPRLWPATACPFLNARITQRVSYPGTAAAGTTILDAEPDGDGAERNPRPDERNQTKTRLSK
jgi:chromosome partitioning protein